MRVAGHDFRENVVSTKSMRELGLSIAGTPLEETIEEFRGELRARDGRGSLRTELRQHALREQLDVPVVDPGDEVEEEVVEARGLPRSQLLGHLRRRSRDDVPRGGQIGRAHV